MKQEQTIQIVWDLNIIDQGYDAFGNKIILKNQNGYLAFAKKKKN